VRERTLALETANRALVRSQRETAQLNALAELLQACVAADEAYRAVEQSGPQLLPRFGGRLYVMHASRNYLECVAAWGDAQAHEQVFEPNDCWALRRGQTHQCDDPTSGMACPHVQATETAPAYLCVPMSAQSETVGSLYLELGKGAAVGIEENERMLASSLADHIALALANVRLRETLRNQSIRDSVTGLYNRRFFEESLLREVARSGRKAASLALVMLDIDHFKRFNDEFGHEAGDVVLQALATSLTQHTRVSDVACRYGGEEFMVLMPETSRAVAVQRAEELRIAVQSLNLKLRGKTLGAITMSLGLAVIPDQAKDAASLVAAADSALYQAKHSGRNRVVEAAIS
jgi:diguanylate cyclase (GGDEF)-like protein